MLIVDRVEYDDVIVLKNVVVPLSKSPLTFVRGRNLDSDAANPTSNGCGKSLIFSGFPNVFLGSPPISLKKRGNTELLSKKTSKIVVHARRSSDSKDSYTIEQSSRGYKISRNGEDMQLSGKTAPQEFLKSLFPFTEDEYYTYGFITSQPGRPFKLQSSSDLDRLAVMVDLFKLDQHTQIKDFFAQKLRSIKEAEVQIGVREARMLKLRKELKRCVVDMTPAELKTAQAKLDKLSAAQQDLANEVRAFEAQIASLSSILDVEEKLDVARSDYKQFGVSLAPNKYAKQLKADLEAVEDYELYQERLREYQERDASLAKRQKRIADSLNPTDIAFGVKSLREAIVAAENNIETMQEAWSAYKVAKRDYEEADAEMAEAEASLKQLGYTAVDAALVTFDADRRGELRAVVKLEELLHDHEDGKCPTCLNAIDATRIKRHVAKAKKELEILDVEQKVVRVYETYSKALTKRSKVPTVAKPKFDLVKAREKLAERRDQLDKLVELESIAKQRDALPKPKRVAEPDVSLSSAEIEERIAFCHKIQNLLSKKEGLLERNSEFGDLRSAKAVRKAIAKLEAELADVDAEYRARSKECAKLGDVCRDAELALSQRSLLQAQYDDEEAEVAKAKPLIEKRRVYEVLIKAYGSKGLKSIAAKSVCALFEQNLNLFRPLAFIEPFEFSIDVSDSGVSIKVDRQNGHPASDVRQLSGAESNAFRLLCLISILPLIPSHRRFNFVCLDEPCALMCEVNRELIMTRYLPALCEVVPNVFFITPNVDDRVEKSAEWLIEKRKGITKLIEV